MCEGCFFGFFEGVDYVLCGFWFYLIQFGQFFCCQLEQICWGMDVFFFYQLVDDFVVYVVNVECVMGDEVFE